MIWGQLVIAVDNYNKIHVDHRYWLSLSRYKITSKVPQLVKHFGGNQLLEEEHSVVCKYYDYLQLRLNGSLTTPNTSCGDHRILVKMLSFLVSWLVVPNDIRTECVRPCAVN